MIISDLNHVESISETTNVLGGFSLGNDYSNVYFNEYFKVNKTIYSSTYVFGHAATAESDAYASGYGSLTQTFNKAATTPYSSSSSGTSIAASSGFYYSY